MMNVVLLNLLIAMMGSTYEDASANAGSGRQIWRLRRTRTILEYSTTVHHINRVPPLVLLKFALDALSWLCWLIFYCWGDTETKFISNCSRRHRSTIHDFHQGQDFLDYGAAPTPQLALHKRWRDQSDRVGNAPGMDAMIRRGFDNLDARLTDMPSMMRMLRGLVLSPESTVEEWLTRTNLWPGRKEVLCDVLNVNTETRLKDVIQKLETQGFLVWCLPKESLSPDDKLLSTKADKWLNQPRVGTEQMAPFSDAEKSHLRDAIRILQSQHEHTKHVVREVTREVVKIVRDAGSTAAVQSTELDQHAEPAVDLPPEGASYDEWLGFLGLLDKKAMFKEGYEVNEEDPFGDLKEIEDSWDDLIDDEDLELDDAGKAKLRAARVSPAICRTG
eukprot:COSAG06_NODE_2106_length_7572_cov_7.446675_4_plen_389_part_00